MLTLKAAVLGLVQGLTEFLPVSSSGHLEAVPALLGWPSAALAFDVALHAGTLLAVVTAFRTDLVALARGALGSAGVPDDRVRAARRLVLVLALGTLPAALAGLVLEDTVAALAASPRAVGLALYGTAVLLWGSERVRRRRGGEEDLDVGVPWHPVGPRDAVLIGFAQALAIVPGISRSGATIAAGMALGMSRRAAARFSFLLSIPIIIGSAIVTLPDLGTPPADALAFGPAQVLVGVALAAGSGFLAIRVLLRLVERRDLLPFAAYVTVLGTVLIGVDLAGR